MAAANIGGETIMTTSTGVTEQGYPKEIFPDGNVEEKYLCNFCRLVLKEPVQSFCGHRFCKNCIEAHISAGNQIKCMQCEREPHDDDEEENYSMINEDQIFPDNAIKREMGRLDVKCAHTGCTWTGKFRSHEEHLTMCDFRPVLCEQCGQLVNKYMLDQHKTNDCKVECDYCRQLVLYSNLSSHKETECPKMSTVCEMCGLGVVREQLVSHQQSQECQAGEIICPAGCGSIPRKNFHDHFNKMKHSVWIMQKITEMSQHESQRGDIQPLEQGLHGVIERGDIQPLEQGLHGVIEQVSTLREQVVGLSTRSSRQYDGTTSSPPGDIDDQVKRIVDSELSNLNDRIEVKTGTFEGIASALHRELEKTITAVEKLEQHRREIESKNEQLHNKVRALERTIALKDMSMAELELRAQSMEAVSYDGTFMWKVAEFSKKHADAVTGRTISIYSPPFYSSRRGYKMCARLYANGDGMGKGSHLSLFFVVMRGNYDALLQWPFTRRVTFCIVNQNGGEHVIDSFRPDPQSSSFKRPTSDMNIASGCPLFIRQEMLNNTNNGFLKDDTLFLKISVDTTDLTDPISSFDERVKPQI